MGDRKFRFGVTAIPSGNGAAWQAQARRYAELGYTSLLMPDGLQLPAPFPSLAIAHAATGLTVGTYVAAAPLRTPAQVAWEAHTLTVLTDGHFEFGIGAGRPAVEGQAAQLGRPFGSPRERLEQVRAAVDALRAADRDGARTPVLMAAGGPRARSLAAECADIVTLATNPMAGRDQFRQLLADVRARAGDRAESIEFLANLFVVGADVTPDAIRYLGVDADAFLSAETMARVSGTPAEMAAELQHRRDDLGLSYVTVNAAFCEQFAPVVARLTGR